MVLAVSFCLFSRGILKSYFQFPKWHIALIYWLGWLRLYLFDIRLRKVKSESESHSVMFSSLQPHGLYSPWNALGQNTGVGSLSLLQRIFPTQGSNPGLPHCRWILNQLSHQENPRILEWVAYPFSRGSSRPRNQTRISCIAGRFFKEESFISISYFVKHQKHQV